MKDNKAEPTNFTATVEVSVYPDEAEHLSRIFDYHPPQDIAIPLFEKLREVAKLYSAIVLRVCPPTRERSLALMKIEEASFFAISSVARNQDQIEVKDA